MAAPLLLDLSHTCHTRARTGIQRVARSLSAELGTGVIGVTYDPFLAAWRTLEPWENANLTSARPANSRGARWPLSAQLRGRARRLLRAAPASLLPGNTSGLLVPEVFSAEVAAALPELRRQIKGPAVAVFHDAIALRLPELTPAKTVARFPAYLQELRQFDGIAAISDDSRDALRDYWRWLGSTNVPPVQTIPLGVEPPSSDAPAEINRADPPVVLCVSSIEGRKNHTALLDACEKLWREQVQFALRLVGVANRETGAGVLARIEALQRAGRPIHYAGPVDDDSVAAAYRACRFTVYPSLLEGFGLPVLESVTHGKPCICAGTGALGEAARGGGCLMLPEVTADAIASSIAELLRDPERLERLAADARQRTIRTWRDYAREISNWIVTVPKRQ